MDGDAISLVCVDESKLLWQIETLLRTKIAVEVVDGFAPDRSIRPQPILLRQGAGRPPVPGRGHMPQRPGHRVVRRAPEAGRHPQAGAHRQPSGPRPAGQRPTGSRQTGSRPPGYRPPVALPGERLARHSGRPGGELREG